VVRGGAFLSPADDVQSSARSVRPTEQADFSVGFRCVRSHPGPASDEL
jgi:formylglycine-generating enzyme required for sulfatase activity